MVVKAVVKLTGPVDHRTFARQVRQHCRARLEVFKVPAIVEISNAVHHNDRFKKSRAAFA
jgi:acyl-CoA synthetase (AMP-forming)/AMP-acid ligase II